MPGGMDSDLLADMAVPEGETREYMLAGLANLIRQRGYEPFVRAPILMPDSNHFPDRWEQNPRGIRTLLRRLLRYAGLDEYEVMLHVYSKPPRIVGAHTALVAEDQRQMHTAAWYAGHDDGVAHFGVDLAHLRHAEVLVGTLGHEVAHLYRDHHGLVVSDRLTEEALTDLTAIYLGFGLFLFESSYTFRTGGYGEEGHALAWESGMLGYLTLGGIALFLGAQLACRGLDRREVKRLCNDLSANQASLLRNVHAELAEDAVGLRSQLGVPAPSEWPAPSDPKVLSVPLEDDGEDEDRFIRQGAEDGVVDEADVRPSSAELEDAGAPSRKAAPKRAAPNVAPSIIGAAVGFGCGAYFDPMAGIALGAVGAGLGLRYSIAGRGYACSRCNEPLSKGIDWCPGCDASVEWS